MSENEITITCADGPPCSYIFNATSNWGCNFDGDCRFQRPSIHQKPRLDRKRVIEEIQDWCKKMSGRIIDGAVLDAICKRIEKL